LTPKTRRQIFADFAGQATTALLSWNPLSAPISKPAGTLLKWSINLFEPGQTNEISLEAKYRADLKSTQIRSAAFAKSGRDKVLEDFEDARILRFSRVADSTFAFGADYWHHGVQRDSLQTLRRQGVTFRVCLASPSIAAMRALLEMNKLLEYPAMNPSFEFSYGLEQVQSITKKGQEWDFLILADAPLYFERSKDLDQYQYEWPIYTEGQCALTKAPDKRGTSTLNLRPIQQALVVGETTLHLQERLSAQLGASGMLAEYSDVFREAEFLEPGKAVMMWEPSAAFLRNLHKLVTVPGTAFQSTLSLYSHKKYNADPALAHAFKALFIQAWDKCQKTETPGPFPLGYEEHFKRALNPLN